MPISGSGGGNKRVIELLGALNGLMAQLLDKSSFPAFKQAINYERIISQNTPTEIARETEQKQLRQIEIRNNGNYPVALQWLGNLGFQSITTSRILHPGEIHSEYDGGTSLYAIALGGSTQLSICIRSEFELEEELVLPLEIELAMPTGLNFDHYFSDPELWTNAAFENFKDIFNSSTGKTGYKLIDAVLFHPGESYEFSIEVQPGRIAPGLIQIYTASPFDILQAGFEIAADLINPENAKLPLDFIGKIKRRGWIANIPFDGDGNTPAEQIKFTWRPNFSKHSCGIYAINPATGYHDAAIIESYNAETKTLKIIGF